MATRQRTWEVEPVGSSGVRLELSEGDPTLVRLTRDGETVTLRVDDEDTVAEVVGPGGPPTWARDAAQRLGIREVR